MDWASVEAGVQMRLILFISVLLNLILGMYLLGKSEGRLGKLDSSWKDPAANPDQIRGRGEGNGPGGSETPEKRGELGTKGLGDTPMGLDWRTIETTDYREYVRRLRQAGMPEDMVRELVVADVRKAYGPRAHALLGTNAPARYWQKPQYDPPTQEQLAQLEALEMEEQGILTEILGSAPRIQNLLDRLYLQVDPREVALDFLSPETREAAMRALDEAGVRHHEMNDPSVAEGGKDPNGMDRFRKRLDVLSEVLTNEELEIYRARIAPVMPEIAKRLQGVELTEQEFIRLVNTRLDTPSVGGEDASRIGMKEVTEILGDERAAQYIKSLDDTYHYAREAAQRYSLPAGVAEDVYALKQASQQEAARIRETGNAEQQKRLELQALRSRTERQMREKLGEEGFGLVSRIGAWLQLLEQPGSNTP